VVERFIHFCKEKLGFDGYRMIPGDDTGGTVWAVAWAWEGLACSEGSAWGKLLDIHVDGGVNRVAVTERKRACRHPGSLQRVCRADEVKAPQRLQQEFRDRLRAAGRTPWRIRQSGPAAPPKLRGSKHFTQEFDDSAATLMREMPVKRAAQILGKSE